MPCGDGTGPFGLGPGTGWGRGPCISRVWRKAYRLRVPLRNIELSKDEQKKILQKELKDLEQEMKAIKDKLKELSK